MLSENCGKLFCTVIAVVEEYHNMSGADSAVNLVVDYWLEEFVCNTLGIRLFHSLYNIVGVLPFAIHKKIVSLFQSLPAMVAVHGIVTADDRSDCACALVAMLFDFLKETGSALGVGVASVHEAVKINLVKAVSLGGVAKGIKMTKA